MSEALLQKLLDQVQGVQASIDSRLATIEKRQQETDGTAGAVKTLRLAMDELKALVLSGAVGGTADLAHYYGFKSEKQAGEFGLFILATVSGRPKAIDMLVHCNKALAEGVNSTGGALVPTEYMSVLINLMARYGKFRQNARVLPMGSDQQIWPKLDSDVVAYFPGEAGTGTPSHPAFSNVSLVPKKAFALTVISSKLEEDSAVAVGVLVADSIARAMAKVEDQAGFLGNGTTTYWGIVGIVGALFAVDGTIGNIKSITVGSGNTYSELLLGDFDRVVGNYPDDFDIPGETFWYMHRYFYYTVVVPLIQAYSSNKPTVGDSSDTAEGWRPMLRGYPVQFISVMPKVEANSQVCALLANLKMGCYLGERRQLRIERSRDAYFTTDQIGIRGTERVAVNCFGTGDTSDPGPICALATAAS